VEEIVGGDEPLVDTATGPVPLPGSPLDVKMKAEAQVQADAAAKQAHENNLAVVTAKGGNNEDNANQPGQSGKGKPAAKFSKKKERFTYQSPTRHPIH
jgi:hypothetical protein